MTADQTKASMARVAKNTAILVILRVVMPAFGLLLVLALSRKLGVEGLGRYSLAFSILYFFNTLGPLGLSAILTREGAKDPSSIERLLSNSLFIAAVASLFLTGLMACMGHVLNYDAETRNALLLLSLSVIPFTVGALFEGAFVALEKMQHIATTMAVEYLFKVGMAVALLYLGYGLYSVLLMAVLGRILSCLLGVRLLQRMGIAVRLSRDPATVRSLLKLAPTFVLITVFASLYWRIDMLMLSKLQPMSEVGYYSAAYRVFELAMVLPYSLCLALYPSIAAAVDNNKPLLASYGRSAMRYLLALTLPAAVCTSVLSESLLKFLYGAGFSDATLTLAVLMWTLVFYGMVRYHAYVLLAANKQRVDLMLNIAMSLVNIALNFVLIPRYSHLGAAVATLISIVTYGVAQYVYLRVKFPGHAAPLALPPVVPIGCAIAALIVWWMKDTHVLIIVAVTVPLYAALLLAGGFFSRAELAFLAQRLPLRMNGARS